MFFLSAIYLLSQILNVFCLNGCDFQPVFSDITPASCYDTQEDGYHWAYKEKKCIPACVIQLDNPMPPCADFYDNLNVDPELLFRPSCDINGYYSPTQCKGQPTTGRCFCSDPKGNRLDGQQWWNKLKSMTCSCSRKKYDLRDSGDYYYVSLHCDSQGNYEPLQCDILNDLCWCADPPTGKVTSTIVPMKARSLLPCYDAVALGPEYLRQCESQDYAQSKIIHEFKSHGTKDIEYSILKCDEDGTYGPYRVTNGVAFCTWKDNTNIGSFQSAGTNTTLLTCNCARDTIVFENDGKEMTQSCEGNGNYEMYQVQSKAYCVDEDGYAFSSRIPDTPDRCQNFLPDAQRPS